VAQWQEEFCGVAGSLIKVSAYVKQYISETVHYGRGSHLLTEETGKTRCWILFFSKPAVFQGALNLFFFFFFLGGVGEKNKPVHHMLRCKLRTSSST